MDTPARASCAPSSPLCWPSVPATGRRAVARRGAPAPAATASPAPAAPPLFRVILNDGTALVSFGEFTRVGDRVVFSMPLDSPRGDRLQLVNLPASVVNWDSTDAVRRRDALRAVRRHARRGRFRRADRRGGAGAERDRARQGPRRAGSSSPSRRGGCSWPGRSSTTATGRPTSTTCCRCSKARSPTSAARPASAGSTSAWWRRSSRRRCRCCRTRHAVAGDRPGAAGRPVVRRAGRADHAAAVGDRRRSTRIARSLSAPWAQADARVGRGAADAGTRGSSGGTPSCPASTVPRANAAAAPRGRARRRAGVMATLRGPRPRARPEAQGPGGGPAGPAAGAPRRRAAPAPDARPVGAQGRRVSRLPPAVSTPIDRLAALRAEARGRQGAGRPRRPRRCPILAQSVRARVAASWRASRPRRTWPRPTRRCSRPPSWAAGDARSRARGDPRRRGRRLGCLVCGRRRRS